MKINFALFPALVLASAAVSQGQTQAPAPAPVKPPATASATTTASTAFPTKIGLINLREAITKTADGQKAAIDLKEKFSTREAALQRRQIELQGKQDQLSRGGSTMSDAAKASLTKELDNDNKTFKRDVEDYQTDAQDEQNKVFMAIWTKMQPVMQKYAMQNGFAAVLDVSGDQSPVLWASNTSFITDDVVTLYNQEHPATAAAPAKTPAPAPAPVKAPAPAPTKKQ